MRLEILICPSCSHEWAFDYPHHYNEKSEIKAICPNCKKRVDLPKEKDFNGAKDETTRS